MARFGRGPRRARPLVLLCIGHLHAALSNFFHFISLAFVASCSVSSLTFDLLKANPAQKMNNIASAAFTAACCLGCATIALTLWHYSVQGGVNTAVQLIEPEQARVFARQMINMFVGSAAVRDLNASHIFMFALIVLGVVAITTADHALERVKAALANKALVPVELVQNAPNAQYDQAIALTGMAASKRRAPIPT